MGKLLQQAMCTGACSVTQSCPTLAAPKDCSPPGSSVWGFPRQEHWAGLPFPPPGNLPDPRIEPASPALVGGLFTTAPRGKPPYSSHRKRKHRGRQTCPRSSLALIPSGRRRQATFPEGVVQGLRQGNALCR